MSLWVSREGEGQAERQRALEMSVRVFNGYVCLHRAVRRRTARVLSLPAIRSCAYARIESVDTVAAFRISSTGEVESLVNGVAFERLVQVLH